MLKYSKDNSVFYPKGKKLHNPTNISKGYVERETTLVNEM